MYFANSFLNYFPDFPSLVFINFSSEHNFVDCYSIAECNSNDSEKYNFKSDVLRVFQQSYSIVLLSKLSKNKVVWKCHFLFYKLGLNGKYTHRSLFFESVHLVTSNKTTFWSFYAEVTIMSCSSKTMYWTYVQTSWKILMKEFIFK